MLTYLESFWNTYYTLATLKLSIIFWIQGPRCLPKERKKKTRPFLFWQARENDWPLLYIYTLLHGPWETMSKRNLKVYVIHLWYLHREILDIVNWVKKEVKWENKTYLYLMFIDLWLRAWHLRVFRSLSPVVFTLTVRYFSCVPEEEIWAVNCPWSHS